MKPLKTLVAAGLVASLPLAALAQTTPPAEEPAKPAETAPAPAPAPAAAPAAAAKSGVPTVQVYGTFNVNFQNTKAAGATNPAENIRARNALSVDSSNVGVKGALNVNEWVGAVYQCETSATLDGPTFSGICNRNSRIGVNGTWGTLFYGNWDTPFKAATYGTKADDPFLSTDVFEYANIMGSPGFNTRSVAWVAGTPSNAASSATGFDLRVGNSVAYHSPKYMGLSGKLQYSANEFMNNTGTVNPELYSAVVNWDYGPFSVLGTVEVHDDGFGLVVMNGATRAFNATTANTVTGPGGAARSEKDIAWRVGAGYELASPIGATTVSALFEELRYKQNHAAGGQVKEYNRQAWQVALKHRYGDHELRARFNQAEPGSCTVVNGPCSTAGYGAYMYAVGYGYYFAKSFQAYVSYVDLVNRKNAQYTFATAGATAIAGSTPKGADPRALGVGLRLAF